MAKKSCGDGFKHRSGGGKVQAYASGGRVKMAIGGAAKIRHNVATKSGAPKAASRKK